MSDLQRDLAELLDATIHAAHDPLTQKGGFGLVFDRFHPIAHSPEMLRRSVVDVDKDFTSLVTQGLRALAVEGVAELVFLRVSGTAFRHCGGRLGAATVVAFWFEDVGIGMLLFEQSGGREACLRLTRGAMMPDIPFATHQLAHA